MSRVVRPALNGQYVKHRTNWQRSAYYHHNQAVKRERHDLRVTLTVCALAWMVVVLLCLLNVTGDL